MKTSKIIISVALATVLGLSGCGGSSDSTPTASSSTITGQFIDSAVEGLEYSCSSETNGMTNANGEYTCNTGDNITFSINGFVIGSAEVQAIITPRTLSSDIIVSTNIAQLLQTLDSDNNPNNGITIDSTSQEVQALSESVNILFTQADFDSAIASYIGKVLVDETTANAHLEASLEAMNTTTDESVSSDASVVILTGVTQALCDVQVYSDDEFDGYTSYADFLNNGGTASWNYYNGEKTCLDYSEAGACQVQDLSAQIGASDSCVSVVTFPTTDTNNETTTPAESAEITFATYTSKYKPMMPNLRTDNIHFNGLDIINNNIEIEYEAMIANEKVANTLYYIGGDPLYGYEYWKFIYTDTSIITQYYDSQTNFSTESDRNIIIVENVHTTDDNVSRKFSKEIAIDTLHQMYLEVGLDINFTTNDKAQFAFFVNPGTYSDTYWMELVMNESGYLKVLQAFEN